MLAVLGFITILLVLALIMSKKVSTLVALIFVPAITGFIAAFINAPNVIIQAAQAAAEKAGTAYVEPVITFGTRFTKALSILSADYMGKGLSSIVATGVMFIFAILFFSTCSDAGVFDPIINQPDAGILGVCAVQDELDMDEEGKIFKKQVMRISFTFDHRLIDGAVAAKFELAIKELLEDPMRILL